MIKEGKVKRLEKFIKDNNLLFVEGVRNKNITILSGFACHIDSHPEEMKKAINNPELDEEIERVYDYAFYNDYGRWWKGEAAKKEYKF